MTIDADREVVVRAADPSQAPTELALCGASHAGKEMRLSTDRKYLARAVELGFRELYLYGPGVPILCRDERRSYLWAVLESEDAIGPNEDAVRNTSPAPGEAPPDSPPSTHGLQEEEQKSTMPRHSNGRSSPPNSAAAKSEAAPEQSGAAESVSVDGLIRQAEEVKNSLRTAATQVSELISGLKRHRKHSRTLQTALSSIRQLQSLDM
ncbi:MAG: hypothetical protein KY475_27255 [Planctomycetes bacterium]|nr:hypothetical protein [Planctomycetota bacterium]